MSDGARGYWKYQTESVGEIERARVNTEEQTVPIFCFRLSMNAESRGQDLFLHYYTILSVNAGFSKSAV